MSTNSSISIKVGNKIKTIYSHWDGYPSWNGRILLDSFKSRGKVEKLIALGNISSLGKKVKPNKVGLIHKKDKDGFGMYDKNHKPIFVKTKEKHTFDRPHALTVVAYGRDREETDQEPRNYIDNIGMSDRQSFNYMFKGGKWYMMSNSTDNRWELLTVEMCKED